MEVEKCFIPMIIIVHCFMHQHWSSQKYWLSFNATTLKFLKYIFFTLKSLNWSLKKNPILFNVTKLKRLKTNFSLMSLHWSFLKKYWLLFSATKLKFHKNIEFSLMPLNLRFLKVLTFFSFNATKLKFSKKCWLLFNFRKKMMYRLLYPFKWL